MLAKANSRINGRLLNSAFTGANDEFLFTSFLRSGLWFYNSRTACYTYLPYGYGSSPYGISYQTTVYGGLSHGGYYPGAAYGANSRPAPSSGGGLSNPISSGMSSSSSAAPVRSMPVSAPPRDMDSGSSSPRGFRSERTVEPGRP